VKFKRLALGATAGVVGFMNTAYAMDAWGTVNVYNFTIDVSAISTAPGAPAPYVTFDSSDGGSSAFAVIASIRNIDTGINILTEHSVMSPDNFAPAAASAAYAPLGLPASTARAAAGGDPFSGTGTAFATARAFDFISTEAGDSFNDGGRFNDSIVIGPNTRLDIYADVTATATTSAGDLASKAGGAALFSLYINPFDGGVAEDSRVGANVDGSNSTASQSGRVEVTYDNSLGQQVVGAFQAGAYAFSQVTAVPEPADAMLILAGLLVVGGIGSRRHHSNGCAD
jgi:hypothetical protein